MIIGLINNKNDRLTPYIETVLKNMSDINFLIFYVSDIKEFITRDDIGSEKSILKRKDFFLSKILNDNNVLEFLKQPENILIIPDLKYVEEAEFLKALINFNVQLWKMEDKEVSLFPDYLINKYLHIYEDKTSLKRKIMIDFNRTKMTSNMLVAMSHQLTQEQKDDFVGEIIVSEKYSELNLRQIPADLESEYIKEFAKELVKEAVEKDCTHIAVSGESCLVFHTWTVAKQEGLKVVQSTTKRISKDEKQEDGSVKKISIFKHVMWREI